jgi:hypothetical protein
MVLQRAYDLRATSDKTCCSVLIKNHYPKILKFRSQSKQLAFINQALALPPHFGKFTHPKNFAYRPLRAVATANTNLPVNFLQHQRELRPDPLSFDRGL